MEALSDLYLNSFGKIFSPDSQKTSKHIGCNKQEKNSSIRNIKIESSENSQEIRMDVNHIKKDRHVSASIEVPNGSRRIRRNSEEPTMSDMMAAMVLSHMSYSPVISNHYKAGSPRSYDSSGVGSWNQDSRRTSPFFPSTNLGRSSGAIPNQEAEDNTSEGWRNHTKSPEILDDTILLQTPTPASKSDASHNSDQEDISDEPQDLSMKTLLAKEAQERNRVAAEQRERIKQEEIELKLTTPQVTGFQSLAFPPNAMPSQLPIPFYYPTSLFPSPYATSLPNELLLRLANASFNPMSNPEILGSSAPGHIDSKMNRHFRRAAPYYKVNDDSAISSPLRSGSPSALAFGSAPASYRLPTSAPIPVSNLSYSPSRYRKMTRSPLSKTPSTFSSSHTRNIPTISIPTNEGGNLTIPRDTSPHRTAGQGYSSFVSKPKASSWNNPTFIHKPSALQNSKLQPGFHIKPSPVTTQSIPPIPLGRKVRGDGKKCRKVYGMENRDIWCTACKWKKACQRFPD